MNNELLLVTLEAPLHPISVCLAKVLGKNEIPSPFQALKCFILASSVSFQLFSSPTQWDCDHMAVPGE